MHPWHILCTSWAVRLHLPQLIFCAFSFLGFFRFLEIQSSPILKDVTAYRSHHQKHFFRSSNFRGPTKFTRDQSKSKNDVMKCHFASWDLIQHGRVSGWNFQSVWHPLASTGIHWLKLALGLNKRRSQKKQVYVGKLPIFSPGSRDDICHKHHKQHLCKIITTRVKFYFVDVF